MIIANTYLMTLVNHKSHSDNLVNQSKCEVKLSSWHDAKPKEMQITFDVTLKWNMVYPSLRIVT